MVIVYNIKVIVYNIKVIWLWWVCDHLDWISVCNNLLH